MTANVFVEQQTECMNIADIKSALESVLLPREESQYMIITVVISPSVGGALAVLRAIERSTGEILLERPLSISPEECADAHRVLRVMLEQFLTGFPIEKWKEKQAAAQPPPPPPPPPRVEKEVIEQEILPLQWLLLMGIDSRWPTPNGNLELGLGLDAGTQRSGFIGHLVFRIGWPRPLGVGRYLETTALLALGWRFSPSIKRQVRLEIRSGALRISGIGYEKNYYQWIVIVEAQLSILWRLGAVNFGPEMAIAPIFHNVHTDSGEKEDIPWIRIGLLLGIPLGQNKIK